MLNPALIEQEFELNPELLYLNHAAVSPWPTRTRKAIEKFALENTHAGATLYPKWLGVELNLRQQLKSLLNAPSVDDIALLKNTSEALSVVAYGIDWKAGDNIITSNQEFPSNRIVWESLANLGVELREADISGEDPEQALFDLADEKTKLITISSVQYASGLKMDLNKIGTFCKGNKILYCVDAIQSLGALAFDVQSIHADFVMADGHKWMLGPEGLAVFYCKKDQREQLKLNQFGWHMVEEAGNYTTKHWRPADSARRFECGSPNMLGIYALNASLSLLLEVGIDSVESQLLNNTQYLIDALLSLDNTKIVSETKAERYAGIVTVAKNTDTPLEVLFTSLSEQGLICAPRGGGIRLSPHFYTPKSMIDKAVSLIDKV